MSDNENVIFDIEPEEQPQVTVVEAAVEEKPKSKKKKEISDERKAQLLEQLARGRETARKNREAKKAGGATKQVAPKPKAAPKAATQSKPAAKPRQVSFEETGAGILAKELRELKMEMRELKEMKKQKREAKKADLKERPKTPAAAPAPAPAPVVQHSAPPQKTQQYRKVLNARSGKIVSVPI